MRCKLLFYRHSVLSAVLGVCIGFCLPTIGAATLFRVPSTFEDYQAYETFVTDTLPDAGATAMCGGYDMSQSVGTTVGEGIARVTGVPGRKIKDGNPLNAVELGMALKEDAFSFPGEPTTCGFVTACIPTNGNEPNRFTPSFIDDHACQRPLDGFRGDDYKDPEKLISYSCGGGKMSAITSDTGFCAELFSHNPSFASPAIGYIRTPTVTDAIDSDTAGGICQRLNEDWIYSLWKKPVKNALDEVTGYTYYKKNCTAFDDPSIKEAPGAGFEFDSYRYCCTDAVLGSANKNCVACTGSECHRGKTVNVLHYDRDWTWTNEQAAASGDIGTRTPVNYQSYFRHYLASYERNRLETGDNDAGLEAPTIEATKVDNSKFDDASRSNIPVSCYGFWYWDTNPLYDYETRFNPANIFFPTSMYRCVIALYYEKSSPLGGKNVFWKDQNNFEQMKATQMGHGAYKGYDWQTNAPYADPAVSDNPRANSDIWVRALSRGFSMLKHSLFTDVDTVVDISNYLLAPDLVLHRSTVQRYALPDSKKEELKNSLPLPKALEAIKEIQLSRAGTMKAFDETVATTNKKRSLVEWWQRIETTMNTYLTPPVVRVIFPPAWSIDLDPLHPLLTPTVPATTATGARRNFMYQPLEYQLEIGEDLLGEVSAYLEDSLLLQYKPIPVTVLVPTASANELRSIAQGWCVWYTYQNPGTTCDNMTGIAGQMHTRLLEYATRIDDARILRSQADKIQAEFLQVHTDIQRRIGQWVIDNTDAYLAWQSAWQDRMAIVPRWQDIQYRYREFHDTTNMPWCMNQRYTLPVYTLLDWWYDFDLSRRTSIGDVAKVLSGTTLPVLPRVQTQTGITFDFSGVYVGTGSIRMPVLQPLPIALQTVKLQAPSPEISNIGTYTVPPALPPVPDFTDDLHLFVRKTLSGALPPLLSDSFTLDEYPTIETELPKIEELIFNMNEAYENFWNLVLVDPEDVKNGKEEDCYALFDGYCKHAEFDLHERIMRIASRPAVFLKEDFESVGAFRQGATVATNTCIDPKYNEQVDWACFQLAPQKQLPQQSWKIHTVFNQQQIDLLNGLFIENWSDTVWQNGQDEPQRVPYSVLHDTITKSYTISVPPVLIPGTATGANSHL